MVDADGIISVTLYRESYPADEVLAEVNDFLSFRGCDHLEGFESLMLFDRFVPGRYERGEWPFQEADGLPGGSVEAGFEGLTLSQTRAWLRGFGRRRVAGMALTGLDPMRQGLSTVKTGQRLLVTALLDLVYARLDALTPYAVPHG
jgi:hypothetical protein